MKKILVIQTAFIGDVVLATSLIENLHQQLPEVRIDILVRKGNESLFESHPFLNQVLVWDKKNNKYQNWVGLLFKIRSSQYDVVINAQRFAATGAWTALSGAKIKIGFDKNPFSFLFTNSVVHQFSEKGQHEIDRNHQLLSSLFVTKVAMPKLYPTASDELAVINYQQDPYLCIAPASVWFTKQFSSEKWVDLINQIPFEGPIYLIGGPGDKNDSAPMHFASAVNASVVAVYCSTLPNFGFGPLSHNSFIVQTNEVLACRPCGIHGKKQCPLKHFDCAKTIKMDQLIAPLLQVEQH